MKKLLTAAVLSLSLVGSAFASPLEVRNGLHCAAFYSLMAREEHINHNPDLTAKYGAYARITILNANLIAQNAGMSLADIGAEYADWMVASLKAWDRIDRETTERNCGYRLVK